MSSTGNTAVTRRLAAILIADVVGYTRLMERDDTGTFSRLRNIRDEVVDPAIVSHGGRIVKTAGDGLIAEFTSALSALRSAVDIQRAMARRNGDVAKEDRIEYRIGINLGDIMIDGQDIAGDGVNVRRGWKRSRSRPGFACRGRTRAGAWADAGVVGRHRRAAGEEHRTADTGIRRDAGTDRRCIVAGASSGGALF